jgi:hypothetical protein
MTQQLNQQSGSLNTNRPALSVVITIVSGARHLSNCLSALARQDNFDLTQLEVIVPYNKLDMEVPDLQPIFPAVQFEPVSLSINAPSGLCHEHFDELRAVGLRLARGEILALLEDHEIPDAHWCSNMLTAHEQSYAAIGGAVENDLDNPVNQATCFFDFGRYQNPLAPGPSRFLTDVNVGYKREAFNKIRHIWEHRFHEPRVHEALLDQGETLWLTPDVVVYQHREGLTLSQAIRERFIWGRYFAGNRVNNAGLPARAAFCILSIAVPAIILVKLSHNVLTKRRLVGVFLKVLPVTLLLILFWYFGELTGYITGRASKITETDKTD